MQSSCEKAQDPSPCAGLVAELLVKILPPEEKEDEDEEEEDEEEDEEEEDEEEEDEEEEDEEEEDEEEASEAHMKIGPALNILGARDDLTHTGRKYCSERRQ
ncbi:hypothetical protein BC937DRAFT_94645 [Endogone sp. FLAS-F59071]|nr:hypothetical protein BC937DRAFT_94645 [Endogone sp. FLAS-F59071]|eukprot:RUS20678.1 hypothetical protein BC937DRAFT_94645 [Endogone sp. FLAS-F59071]